MNPLSNAILTPILNTLECSFYFILLLFIIKHLTTDSLSSSVNNQTTAFLLLFHCFLLFFPCYCSPIFTIEKVINTSTYLKHISDSKKPNKKNLCYNYN